MSCVYNKEKQKHEKCRFCEWMRKWGEWTEKHEERCINETDNDDFVAVLENSPRVDGEILIISTRHDSKPYDDISDISRFSAKERKNLFNILKKTIRLMKDNLKAEKVYLYCFCEHWEKNEIKCGDKKTTEHLHFHLLPRYKPLRIYELAAEKIFDIPTRKLGKSELQALKNKLLRKKII